jgi:hypothetical protein
MVRPGSPTRQGSSIIPPEWEAHHTPVVAGQMTATVTVWSGPHTWVYDPATGTETRDLGTRIYPPPGAPVQTAPGRFQQLTQAGSASQSGQQLVAGHTYRVTIPRGCDAIPADGYVRIETSSDGSASGLVLAITGILRGSLRWQRDLLCDDRIDLPREP